MASIRSSSLRMDAEPIRWIVMSFPPFLSVMSFWQRSSLRSFSLKYARISSSLASSRDFTVSAAWDLPEP